MRKYAKFCKIKIDDKNYQLNLTEGGYDTAHFIGRAVSVLRLVPIAVFIGFALKNLFTFLFFKTFSPNDIVTLISMYILTAGFCTPKTGMGNGFNAIFNCFSLKRKRVKYYENMRILEVEKNRYKNKPKKIQKLTQKQEKITENLLHFFYKKTKRCNSLTKGYYKTEKKKGYVEGLKAFALENLEMYQEEIDKFIFHNIGLFKKLCPRYENFLLSRFEKRYNDIVNEEPIYDEFLDAIEYNENHIKNDCIIKNESSNYLETLKNILNIQSPQQKEIHIEPIKNNQAEILENKVENKELPKGARQTEKVYVATLFDDEEKEM